MMRLPIFAYSLTTGNAGSPAPTGLGPLHAGRLGHTALIFAAYFGYADVVKALIPGNDLFQADETGKTPLIVAACWNHAEVLKMLIPGSDWRQADKTGRNAYAHALSAASRGCVDVLAAHAPQGVSLSWPEAARPEDLLQWFARREHQALNGTLKPLSGAALVAKRLSHRL